MVQSSGTGKTRLVFEYAEQKRVPLFYACFRQTTESGYPFGMRFRGNMLDALKDNISARAFVTAMINQIQSLDPNSRKAFFSAPMKNGPNVSSDQTDVSLFAKFWLAVLAAATELCGDSKFVEQTKSDARVEFKFQPFASVKCLVVFDEARALLGISSGMPYFIHLRRAISYFSADLKKAGIMIVFVDTSSKVANFSPPASHMTSSWRGDGYQLLPPFHNVANSANLFWQNNPSAKLDDSTVLFFGRPLWWSKFVNDDQNIGNLFEFARQKILCSGKKFSQLDGKHVLAASAAIICCLLDLSPTPGTELSVNLISSHMVRVPNVVLIF
jgi:hypothetical protein